MPVIDVHTGPVPMLVHLEKDGLALCGSTREDLDLTNDIDEVDCGRCLRAHRASSRPARKKSEPPKSTGKRVASDFYSYDELRRLSGWER